MKRLLFLLTALPCATLFAQIKIGGTGTPKASAVLEVDGGGTKGMLIPQVTQAQRTTSITNPAQGLLVYQTDGVVGFYVNRSSIPSTPNWSMLSEGGSYWTSANSSPNDISNINSGNVGIGTFAPMRGGLVVDKKVGAINAIFGSSTTGIAIESSYPGIGFNTYYNAGRRYMTSGFGGYVGVDPLAGQFNIFMSDSNSTVLGSNFTTDRLRFRILKNGFIGIQGNDNPQAPLSFSNELGDKLNFYNNSSTSRYGIGIQGNRFQFYTTTVNDVFQFGYGTSSAGAAFTETMRIQNNGNVGFGTATPGAKLDIFKGRLRFTANAQSNYTQGIEFTTANGANLNGFIGPLNDTVMGFYGYAGAGWSLLFNNKNGNLGLQGNSDPRVPLSFATALGKKISLYRGTTGDAGFGVYGNELRIASDYNGADITFGYDVLASNSFSENMRVKGNGNVGIGIDPTEKLEIRTAAGSVGWKHSWAGNASIYSVAGTFLSAAAIKTANTAVQFTSGNNIGVWVSNNGNVGIGGINPGYMLDVNGRMRLKSNGNSSGIWFNNSSNIETAFAGMYTDTKWGVYGTSGWQFAVDAADGTVYCGSPNLDNEALAKGAGYKLKVFGKILTEEVRVQLKAAWPDYVFGKDYKLAPLEDVADFIKNNNHLPNVPAAAEVEKSGIALGEMQSKMMEKIEELTLYVIDLKKEIEALKQKK